MGQLKSMAINEHASHCFEGEAEKTPCCNEVSEEWKIDEVTTTSFDFDLSPDLYQVAIITFILHNQTLETYIKKPLFQEHSPPLLKEDILILHQSFLI